VRRLALLWVLTCWLPGLLAAGEPARAERKISLDEVVRLALERNLTLAAEKINPERADTVIVEQVAIFDPVTNADLSASKTKQQQTSPFAATLDKHVEGNAGVTKLFPLGTQAQMKLGANRDRTDLSTVSSGYTSYALVNPAYQEVWSLAITQPLLRGFGVRVNTASIAAARNQRRIAQAQLRDVALKTVSQAKKAYWDLIFAIRYRVLVQVALERAQNLLRDVQARVEAKVLGERDPSVAQARASVAAQQEQIVVVDSAIRQAEDALKGITDLATDPTVWGLALVPTTEPPVEAPSYEAEKAVETALARRPDYQAAELNIDNQDIVVYVRKNELLPQLNLVAGGGNTGLGSNWASSDRRFRSLDWYNWSIGLNFEYPLGNRAARARYRRAGLERQQAAINLQALALQIQVDVRNAVRQVSTNAERLAAAGVTVAAEQERLRAEEIRFREAHVGTSQDVLDAQVALADAESRRLRALIDLNESVVDVQQLQGTLLENSNVVFEEE